MQYVQSMPPWRHVTPIIKNDKLITCHRIKWRKISTQKPANHNLWWCAELHRSVQSARRINNYLCDNGQSQMKIRMSTKLCDKKVGSDTVCDIRRHFLFCGVFDYEAWPTYKLLMLRCPIMNFSPVFVHSKYDSWRHSILKDLGGQHNCEFN